MERCKMTGTMPFETWPVEHSVAPPEYQRFILGFQLLEGEIAVQIDSVIRLVFLDHIGAGVLEDGSCDISDRIY
jgi:hypothetical protein